MQKVNSLSILRVEACGFKKFQEPVSFDLGEITTITGGNRQGKSSISDIIAYTFTGGSFMGERNITDRLRNDGSTDLYTSVTYLDDTGTTHTLKRARTGDSDTLLTLDGRPIRQMDVDQAFGGPDVFLSMLNPAYLTEIAPDKAKEVISEFLPHVSHEDVLVALHEGARNLLQNEQIPSPELFQKRQRQEIKALEASIAHLDGKLDVMSQLEAEWQTAMAAAREELGQVNSTVEALHAKRDADRTDCTAALDDLKTKYQALAADAGQTKAQLTGQMSAVADKLAEVGREQYISDTSGAIRQITDEQQRLSAAHEQLKVTAAAITGGACPSCKRPISDTERGAIAAEVQASHQQIAARWQQLKIEHQAAIDADNLARLAFSEEQSKRLNELRQLAVDIEAALLQEPVAGEMGQLERRIKALEWAQEYGSLTEAEAQVLQEATVKKAELERQLAQDNPHAATIDLCTRQKAELVQKIEGIQSKIQATISYSMHRSILLFRDLPLNKVALHLRDVVKSTGEAKDVFRFTYDGRELRKLSLSEKICAGLEVSEMMKTLTGRRYPTIVDNYESVEEITNIQPRGQYLFLCVLRKAPLSVTIHKPTAQEPLQKAG